MTKRLSRGAICLHTPIAWFYLSDLICFWLPPSWEWMMFFSGACTAVACSDGLWWCILRMFLLKNSAAFSALISLKSYYTPHRLAAPCHSARIYEVTLETQALPDWKHSELNLKYIYFGLLSSLHHCINQNEITQITHNIYITFHNMWDSFVRCSSTTLLASPDSAFAVSSNTRA